MFLKPPTPNGVPGFILPPPKLLIDVDVWGVWILIWEIPALWEAIAGVPYRVHYIIRGDIISILSGTPPDLRPPLINPDSLSPALSALTPASTGSL